jgi:hypothetical protein
MAFIVRVRRTETRHFSASRRSSELGCCFFRPYDLGLKLPSVSQLEQHAVVLKLNPDFGAGLKVAGMI